MGRPAMKPEKKKQGLSVSLPAEIVDLAASTGNSSLFVQRSIETCRGLFECLSELRDGKMKRPDFAEEIEDLLDSWNAQFDEYMPIERALPKKGAR